MVSFMWYKYEYWSSLRFCVCTMIDFMKTHKMLHREYALVHKRMSIITFEGLSITFKASKNVYFTYFCHIRVITHA